MLSTTPSQHKPLDLQSQKMSTDSVTTCFPITSLDFVDHPVRRDILKPDRSEEQIFLHMKSEYNRRCSFLNKWPIQDITPESLSAAGLFYLQQEDKVQCPFCYIILFNWTQGDKPLREHMKRSPKCPFVIGHEVGNIPLWSKIQLSAANSVPEGGHSSHSVSESYKPKHPKMADLKQRILTYSGWLLNEPAPSQLAECGLFYSGIDDVVTCFFCGGTLGNWEPDDNPWNEHFKFFPECTFLAMTKIKKVSSNIVNPTTKPICKQLNSVPTKIDVKPSYTKEEIIEQALDIFPQDLVHEAVKRRNGSAFSLQELCDTILEETSVTKQLNLVPTKIDVKPSYTKEEIIKQALDIFPQDLVHEAVKRRNGSAFSLQELCDTILEETSVTKQLNLVPTKIDVKPSYTKEEIIKQALDIFPQDLVHEAVKRRNGSAFSLQELCDTILEETSVTKQLNLVPTKIDVKPSYTKDKIIEQALDIFPQDLVHEAVKRRNGSAFSLQELCDTILEETSVTKQLNLVPTKIDVKPSYTKEEIIKQALDIFPQDLVHEAVKRRNGSAFSLQELCDTILEETSVTKQLNLVPTKIDVKPSYTKDKIIEQALDIFPQDLVHEAVKRRNGSAFSLQELCDTILEETSVTKQLNLVPTKIDVKPSYTKDKIIEQALDIFPQDLVHEAVKRRNGSAFSLQELCDTILEETSVTKQLNLVPTKIDVKPSYTKDKIIEQALDIFPQDLVHEAVKRRNGSAFSLQELCDTILEETSVTKQLNLVPTKIDVKPSYTKEEIIKQALDIFPQDLVHEAVKRRNGSAFSLQELCDTILEETSVTKQLNLVPTKIDVKPSYTKDKIIEQALDIFPQDLVHEAVKRRNGSAFSLQELCDTILEETSVTKQLNLVPTKIDVKPSYTKDKIIEQALDIFPQDLVHEAVKRRNGSAFSLQELCDTILEETSVTKQLNLVPTKIDVKPSYTKDKIIEQALDIFPQDLVHEAVKRRNGSAFSLQELCDTILEETSVTKQLNLVPTKIDVKPSYTKEEIIKQALDIFPQDLVHEAVKRRNGSAFSLQELCDTILEETSVTKQLNLVPTKIDVKPSYTKDKIIEQALDIFPQDLVHEAVKRRNGSAFSLQELCDTILEETSVTKQLNLVPTKIDVKPSYTKEEIIKQALDIFPQDLVHAAVKRSRSAFSLQELCDTILEETSVTDLLMLLLWWNPWKLGTR